MKLALEGRLAYGGHPVLAWMVDNVHVCRDPAGNIKPEKKIAQRKSTAWSPPSWLSTEPSETEMLSRAGVCMTGGGYFSFKSVEGVWVAEHI